MATTELAAEIQRKHADHHRGSRLAIDGGVPVAAPGEIEEIWPRVSEEEIAAVTATLRSGNITWLNNAEVPELEITRYAIDLRSMSQGTGSFTRSYLRYEPLPSHLADKVVSASKKDG